MHATERSRDEILALLFQASMSGNVQHWADANGVEIKTLRQWKVRYLEDYVAFLEAVLYRIKDQIDY